MAGATIKAVPAASSNAATPKAAVFSFVPAISWRMLLRKAAVDAETAAPSKAVAAGEEPRQPLHGAREAVAGGQSVGVEGGGDFGVALLLNLSGVWFLYREGRNLDWVDGFERG